MLNVNIYFQSNGGSSTD